VKKPDATSDAPRRKTTLQDFGTGLLGSGLTGLGNLEGMLSDSNEERFCSECSHLLGRRTNSDLADTWKCLASENVLSTSRDLVTGRVIYHLRFETCYDSRTAAEDLTGCGSDGRWFVKYDHPGYQQTDYPARGKPKVVGGMKMTADALLAELEQLPKAK